MSIQINGTSGISGVDGSATTPALQGTDTNTGISFGTDTVNVVTGGSTRTTVDSSGRLLVGTSTSSSNSKLHVVGTFSQPTISLQDYYGAGTLGSGDLLSAIEFGAEAAATPASSLNAAKIEAVADGTWSSSSDTPSRLVFSTTADGASSPTERVRISQAGHIGLFGTDPATEVRGLTSGYGFRIQRNSYLESSFDNNGYWILNNTQGSGTRYMVAFRTSGVDRGYITSDGVGVSYGSQSDYRLKENIVDLDGAIDRVKQLAPKRFNFIENPDKTIDGFLAHEAQTVVPECATGFRDEVEVWKEGETLPDGVSVGDNKLNENGDTIPVYQGIDQSKLVPLLTAALQEAIGKIEALETRVAQLEGGAA